MDALEYEYLIRRIYRTGRTSVNGAEADLYRKMERAEKARRHDLENISNKRMRSSTKSIDQLRQEYESECIRIWQWIQKAVRKALQDHSSIFDIEELQQITAYSEKRELPLKPELDIIITGMNQLLASKKIYPR